MKYEEPENANLTDEALSRALRSLPSRVPPVELRTALLVAASRERKALFDRRDFGARLSLWRGHLNLAMNNFMRPMALPFAGGVFSAVVT